jgi:transglutaminase-like putative cysteine protease
MLIEAGFDVAFECPAATPMILQLSTHPSRDADLLTPDRIVSDPFLPMRSYLDLFGNRVTRVEVPAGLVTFSDRFIIRDSGEPDETPPDVRTTPIADLPDETLLFLLPSRYCDSDKLADFAWSQFGKLSGALCVQAICDFVHAKIRFSARVVGIPSACIASLTRYSRRTGPNAARPSPRRENGVLPAPFNWTSRRSPLRSRTSPRRIARPSPS